MVSDSDLLQGFMSLLASVREDVIGSIWQLKVQIREDLGGCIEQLQKQFVDFKEMKQEFSTSQQVQMEMDLREVTLENRELQSRVENQQMPLENFDYKVGSFEGQQLYTIFTLEDSEELLQKMKKQLIWEFSDLEHKVLDRLNLRVEDYEFYGILIEILYCMLNISEEVQTGIG